MAKRAIKKDRDVNVNAFNILQAVTGAAESAPKPKRQTRRRTDGANGASKGGK